jgi:hypothetical protein
MRLTGMVYPLPGWVGARSIDGQLGRFKVRAATMAPFEMDRDEAGEYDIRDVRVRATVP